MRLIAEIIQRLFLGLIESNMDKKNLKDKRDTGWWINILIRRATSRNDPDCYGMRDGRYLNTHARTHTHTERNKKIKTKKRSQLESLWPRDSDVKIGTDVQSQGRVRPQNFIGRRSHWSKVNHSNRFPTEIYLCKLTMSCRDRRS